MIYYANLLQLQNLVGNIWWVTSISANKQQKPTPNNNKLQDIFQGLTTSSTFNTGLTYVEESVLQPVAMMTISDHVFDDSSRKEYIDLQPFKLSAVNGCETSYRVRHNYGNTHFIIVLDKKQKFENFSDMLMATIILSKY